MARIQPPRASSGTKSPACFFSIFAAFFSFGVSRGCFLVSLLLFFSLDIRSSPGSGGIFGQTRQRPALSFLQRSSAHAGHLRGLTFLPSDSMEYSREVTLPHAFLSAYARPCLLRIPLPYVPSPDRFLPAALECSLCLCQKNTCVGHRLTNLKHFLRLFQFCS